MSSLPIHIDLGYFEVVDGELEIGGQTVSALYQQLGKPYYAYAKNVISTRIAELRSTLPAGIDIHYAMKANPMPELVRFVGELVDGIDVASGAELTTALTTQVSVEEISFAGPAKSKPEIEQAIRAGIVLNVESTTELNRISEICKLNDLQAKVAIRVNPDFELKGSGMRMSGGPKQFGIDAEVVPDVLRSLDLALVSFQGLHIFSGSQNLNADAICEAQQKSIALALSLCEQAQLVPRFLNLGGGFGIPYFPGDKRLSLDPIAANLISIQTELEDKYPSCKLVLELGRYIVGEAGIYVCEITDIKNSRGHRFLVTNGGLHHHLSASGNFGQVIRKNYPVTIATKLDDDAFVEASVVGPLCTPLDLLANNMALQASAEIGDLVAVFQSGAYGYSASPHGFLSHPGPAELLL